MKAAFEAAGVTVIHRVNFGMQAQRIGLPAPAMRTGALRAAVRYTTLPKFKTVGGNRRIICV